MADTLNCFCAAEGVVTAHKSEVDRNGELVLTCPCGRFWKLPAQAVTDTAFRDQLIADHQTANQ